RVAISLQHMEPDRIPMDIGGSAVTGMHVNTVYALRQALHLDPPGTPVKVAEPYQLLGEIKPDLMAALGIDVVSVGKPQTLFGYKNEGWKPWTTPQGVPSLVPAAFNTDAESDGQILMYPEGDKSVPASGRLPVGGFYFDTIIRQEPVDDDALNVDDNLEEFTPINDEDLQYLKVETDRLYRETDKAILANFGGTAFGDIALVPAPFLKHPKGIRDVAEWYMSTVSRRDYIYELFERQCDVALKNLERIHAVVGERITAVFVTGTDFGAQTATFISPRAYRDLYQPFHKRVNDWMHTRTKWKSFIHSCGSVRTLIPHFIEAGFDILNPVQTSATNMAPHELKRDYGSQIAFWGGGVDTQRTLPFGTPDEVRQEVRERLRLFGKGGGFIFNPIHNVQAQTPIENLIAMFDTVREFGQYPLS
ncbi:MAG TPA: uroporphyrinogen decarboxylase family protein, partial [Anaerolineae bacterium]